MTMRNRTRLLNLSLLCSVLLVAGLGVAQAQKPAVAIADAVLAIATVQDIDHETRVVTLRYADGDTRSFTAGKTITNLDQVNKGDVVLMEYYEGFAIAVGPKGTGIQALKEEVAVQRAKPGEKPAGTVTETIDVIAVVKKVDKKTRRVTVQGAERTLVLKAADDIDLDSINVGDEVRARYVESFAISVVPAPKVSGTVEIESKSVALGVGVQWGHGLLTMYDGSTHKLKIHGLSLLDLGFAKVSLSGEVYELSDPKDVEGVYAAGVAGVALGKKGVSDVVMKNGHGVIMRLKSKQEGAKLTLASEGIKVTLVK